MDYIFDKEKLNKVLCDFYSSTGIAITLYDASKEVVATLPGYSPYCSCIRTNQVCLENCGKSNLVHMNKVCRDGRSKKYSCHAGMMEMILPIIYEEVLIAYLQIGQFRDAEEIYSSAEKLKDVAVQYGFDERHLLDLYKESPVVSEEKLNALYNVLEILIKSFWWDGLITHQRSMLSIKVEKYIDEHLTEKIYIEDLCKEFYLSKNALYGMFRDEFHTTVGDFITQKRLQTAQKYLMEKPDISVAQVASMCGFADYNYFIRLFKKHIGKTPLRFRRGDK